MSLGSSIGHIELGAFKQPVHRASPNPKSQCSGHLQRGDHGLRGDAVEAGCGAFLGGRAFDFG